MQGKLRVKVGSTNNVKVEAVREILRDYPHLAHAEVETCETDSGVSAQPKSLEETIEGAINRAKQAFKNCDLSVGLESGLMSVPKSRTGHMDVCACAIYDGREFYFGLSSAWEFRDRAIIDSMLGGGLDMSEAINRAGLTTNPKIGEEEGAIGILTKGRLTRKEYTKQAIRMALIHLEGFQE